MPETSKMSDHEKHHLEQYNRMQDILVQYSMTAVKSLFLLSSGALVTLGAAIIKISTECALEKDCLKVEELLMPLKSSFTSFSYSVIMLVISLFTIFISRSFYLVAADEFGRNEATKRRSTCLGTVFEALSIILYIVASFFSCWGLHDIYRTF